MKITNVNGTIYEGELVIANKHSHNYVSFYEVLLDEDNRVKLLRYGGLGKSPVAEWDTKALKRKQADNG